MLQRLVHITRLLLLVCLLVAQWSMASGSVERHPKAAPETEQTSNQEKESPTIQEWFVTSLAPSHQFHFDEVVFDWPLLTWGVVYTAFRPAAAPQGNYSRVFFSKIFERLIAINAP